VCRSTALKEIRKTITGGCWKNPAEKKWKELKGEQYLVRQKKTQDFLLQRGVELELVAGAVKALREQ